MRKLEEVMQDLIEHIGFVKETNSGLCYLSYQLRLKGVISSEEEHCFDNYYCKATKNRKVFYTDDGQKSSSNCLYAWKSGAIRPRVNWLRKQIAKLQRDELAKYTGSIYPDW
jgi:hypothetical protein